MESTGQAEGLQEDAEAAPPDETNADVAEEEEERGRGRGG